MKKKFSISLLVVTLSCAFAFIAFAESTKIEEENVNMELSENEVIDIVEQCKAIAVENELEGDDLTAYVDECFAANTMVMEEANSEEEPMSDDQDVPALEDESLDESEETAVEEEEPATESDG